MASYHFWNRLNQVRDSPCFINSTSRHGFSKSQMCLQKILHVITSCSPQDVSKETSLNREILEFKENKGVGIDLNMGLSPAWSEADNQENQSSEESSLLSAYSFVEKGLKNDSSMEVFGVDGNSSVGECCVKVAGNQFGNDSPTAQATGEESQGVAETTLEISKTTNSKNQASHELSSKIKTGNGDQEITKLEEEDTKKELVKLEPCHEERTESNKDSLTLLIEAAEMFSGNLEDKESDSEKREETSSGSKKSCKCSWVVDLYEDSTSSPVVRSKRGRSRVLPYRTRGKRMYDNETAAQMGGSDDFFMQFKLQRKSTALTCVFWSCGVEAGERKGDELVPALFLFPLAFTLFLNFFDQLFALLFSQFITQKQKAKKSKSSADKNVLLNQNPVTDCNILARNKELYYIVIWNSAVDYSD
ncbi:hypothetical protein SADUNF_Sadunf04G0134600 [Salix dunnii]|uniref:Uncharacterized protein n=1 Tax=Salix dunnii TaxID=1413687 RepID=A0A835KBP0_9ROSI|nr:hypothetical protein SADUNF_Sadunf04G0134600 [Salix dunnii]